MMRTRPWCVLIGLGMLALAIPCYSAGDVRVGVKGGLNVANLTGDDVFNNSTDVGGIVGAFGRYGLSDIFSLQLEALYTMKGAQFSVGDIETEQSIDYIEIPLLLRAAWANESKFEPALYVGPALGILLSNKITDGAEIDLKDGSKSTDFGVVVGADVEYEIGKGAALLDVRYERGFVSWSDDLDEKNSVFSFMVGYGIKL